MDRSNSPLERVQTSDWYFIARECGEPNETGEKQMTAKRGLLYKFMIKRAQERKRKAKAARKAGNTKPKPLTGTSSADTFAWKDIQWPCVESSVRRLQMRIAKAVQEGRHNCSGLNSSARGLAINEQKTRITTYTYPPSQPSQEEIESVKFSV